MANKMKHFSSESIHEVNQQDLQLVKDFLLENKLKNSIKLDLNSIYLYIQNDGQIIGTIGAEFNQEYALIRAAGVAQPFRNHGIGQLLFEQLVHILENKGIMHLYLFSRQAGDFWTKLGFTQCSVLEIIRLLSDAPQVVEFLSDNSIWTDIAWRKPTKTKNENSN